MTSLKSKTLQYSFENLKKDEDIKIYIKFFLIIKNRIYCDIFIHMTENRFLIYSYFITSEIFLII